MRVRERNCKKFDLIHPVYSFFFFKLQAGSDVAGITEKGFYSWLMREPQTIIWLPTLHRLTAAETGSFALSLNLVIRM